MDVANFCLCSLRLPLIQIHGIVLFILWQHISLLLYMINSTSVHLFDSHFPKLWFWDNYFGTIKRSAGFFLLAVIHGYIIYIIFLLAVLFFCCGITGNIILHLHGSVIITAWSLRTFFSMHLPKVKSVNCFTLLVGIELSVLCNCSTPVDFGQALAARKSTRWILQH